MKNPPVYYHQLHVQVEITTPSPQHSHVEEVIESMRSEGVHVVYGTWLIDGSPKVRMCIFIHGLHNRSPHGIYGSGSTYVDWSFPGRS